MRDWTNPADFGAAGTGGATGINSTQWTTIRGVDYRGAEMIGAMMARLVYSEDGASVTDFVVSAAPNILYKGSTGTYSTHNSGPTGNDGTQVHSEMIMAAQLTALLAAVKATQEPLPDSNRTRPALSAGQLNIDVDLFIEKGTMCAGCTGTWDTFFETYAGNYRI
jgi:hypothetical protein